MLYLHSPITAVVMHWQSVVWVGFGFLVFCFVCLFVWGFGGFFVVVLCGFLLLFYCGFLNFFLVCVFTTIILQLLFLWLIFCFIDEITTLFTFQL